MSNSHMNQIMNGVRSNDTATPTKFRSVRLICDAQRAVCVRVCVPQEKTVLTSLTVK